MMDDDDMDDDGWSFRVWRTGDVIAQERTDVAGVMRRRPAVPARAASGDGGGGGRGSRWGVARLGHPDGRGAYEAGYRRRRGGGGEYLTDGSGDTGGGNDDDRDDRTRTIWSSTVGTGNSKWVEKRKFRPWNPNDDIMRNDDDANNGKRTYGRRARSADAKPESSG